MQQTRAYHTKFICLIFLEFFFTGIHDIIKYWKNVREIHGLSLSISPA